MKQIVIGYVAGIIDGEGYIGITNQGRSARVIVTSTDENLPRKLAAMTKKGYAAECKRRPDGRRVVAWQWLCLGEKAFQVLQQVYPMLIVKRAQAKHVLEFAEYLGNRPNPDANLSKSDAAVGIEFAKKIRALNSRERNKLTRLQTQRMQNDLWAML